MGNNKNYAPPGSVKRTLSLGSPVNEGPERDTSITSSFYILDTEVTSQLYCVFLNQHHQPSALIHPLDRGLNQRIELIQDEYLPKQGLENHAINCATWEGSVEFCKWLSQQTNSVSTLPTEAQWEFAARGATSRRYPWGNIWAAGLKYYDSHNDAHGRESFGTPVRSYAQNATDQGVYDLLGGVPEWTLDGYSEQYDPLTTTDPLVSTSDTRARVLRGRLSTTSRDAITPSEYGQVVMGFRPILILEDTPSRKDEDSK